jgi:hypothetical protein
MGRRAQVNRALNASLAGGMAGNSMLQAAGLIRTHAVVLGANNLRAEGSGLRLSSSSVCC